MIDIVKASAGSGKTFLLAKTYISLLFKAGVDHPYRHILAVTFTNKATEEMKSRILKELDILARTPEKSDYFEEFCGRFGTASQIQKKAEIMLYDILHDYSAFSVSTIDKFFQTALKSFAREVGQFSTYQIELDKDSLVRESVDRMLDALTEDERVLLEWLTESAMEQLEEGRKARLEDSLFAMAKALKSDAHRQVVEENGIDEEKAYSKENLKAVRKVCRQCRKEFLEKVRNAAQKILDVFQAAGVDPIETNGKFVSIALYKYVDENMKDVEAPTPAFINKAADPEKWFAKAKAKTMLPKFQGLLEDPFREFIDLFGEEYRVYKTASVLEKQVYSLGIASEFSRSFNELMKEKNVLNLDDSNTLLRKIIDGTDTPFIYEKLGVRYTNFLLDEFQDTSTIQWDNFKPLVKESSDNNNDNLIVGDVKQSIYRWRGSDWHLLDSEIKEDFPDADDTKPLRANWRSLDQVVSFNNGFFSYAASELDIRCGNTEVSRIYRDVVQDVKVGSSGEGMLDFTFCNRDCQLDVVLDSIRNIHSEGGADYGQIAVLVRTNKDGAKVASYLIANGIPVISDDSLRVKSSLAVRRLASLLHFVDNPRDSVNGYLAKELDIRCPDSYLSVPDLAEELLRSLRKVNPESLDSEVLYIQSFMDTVQEWTSANGNNLNAFLGYWDGQDPAISSPQDPKAVRIITIHKSKGLEFPYVIFPFAESVKFNRNEQQWCTPKVEGTALETGVGSAYHVLLSGKSAETLFGDDYIRERNLQIIDNFNTLYVALTRAGKGLHVIAAAPGKDDKNMADLLCKYINESQEFDFSCTVGEDEDGQKDYVNYHSGTMPDFSETKRKASLFGDRVASYPSFPLNPEPGDQDEDVRERGRLKFSADAIDFFSAEPSPRLKGIVLHDILSDVVVPSDLDEAVSRRIRHGDIDVSESVRYKELLADRIASVSSKGWFPDDRSLVENEVSVVDVDGTIHRPDRVVLSGGSVTIVDYKFGEENPKYLRQIARYARLYKEMGYADVKACLWYVYENKFVYL